MLLVGYQLLDIPAWSWYWVLLKELSSQPAQSWYWVQDWFLAGTGQVCTWYWNWYIAYIYIYMVLDITSGSKQDRYWYKAGIVSEHMSLVGSLIPLLILQCRRLYIYIITTVATNIYPHTYTAHFLYCGSLSLSLSLSLSKCDNNLSAIICTHTAHQDFWKMCVCYSRVS